LSIGFTPLMHNLFLFTREIKKLNQRTHLSSRLVFGIVVFLKKSKGINLIFFRAKINFKNTFKI